LTEEGPITDNFFEDALHIAVAAVNGMQFILTWNCHHINNPYMRSAIIKIVESSGYECPVICTPDEFMEGTYET
jgi:preprotein translocase subunit SecB